MGALDCSMGAVTRYTKAFAHSAKEAQKKAWEEDREYYGHREGYSGALNAKPKGKVKVIQEEDYKHRDRWDVAEEILSGDNRFGEKYPRIQSRSGPTGAVPLKGTQEAQNYRERSDLKGKHGTVWLLFGWCRS